jgi:hypothetical protein
MRDGLHSHVSLSSKRSLDKSRRRSGLPARHWAAENAPSLDEALVSGKYARPTPAALAVQGSRSMNPVNNLAALGFAVVGVVITLIGFGFANKTESGSGFVRIVALLMGFSSIPALQALANAEGVAETAVTYWGLLLAGFCLIPRVFGAKTSGFSLGWFVLVFCLLVYSWTMRTR